MQSTQTGNTVVIAYGLICAALIMALINGSIAGFLNLLELHGNFHGIYAFLSIIFLGMLACTIIGAKDIRILCLGMTSGFIALTYNQEPLIRYLSLGAVLFSLGMFGMVASRNAVRVLMSIELMLNAVNINFVAFARYVDPVHIRGQLFAIFILTVAAAEAVVGLAIVLSIYRNTATVDMERFNLLKW